MPATSTRHILYGESHDPAYRSVFCDFCKHGVTIFGVLLHLVGALSVATAFPTTTEAMFGQLGAEVRASLCNLRRPSMPCTLPSAAHYPCEKRCPSSPRPRRGGGPTASARVTMRPRRSPGTTKRTPRAPNPAPLAPEARTIGEAGARTPSNKAKGWVGQSNVLTGGGCAASQRRAQQRTHPPTRSPQRIRPQAPRQDKECPPDPRATTHFDLVARPRARSSAPRDANRTPPSIACDLRAAPADCSRGTPSRGNAAPPNHRQLQATANRPAGSCRRRPPLRA